ncbi:ATP-binding cassette domain-containing protein [Sphingobium sp. CR2-8]|uniref:ATP-binding cassette domain-containing protein n=1 Tax=Sphingobium sp. CR2-8 TaxID=1306534 RepID=UPI002DBCD811|nr:ATP-binding cassette domain-containing protein [Sphingobium sp. CR2-8]MEC3912039.1 ATP-binding cassette domain-containing protein [Sphingobium sp. CR2-8]
MSFDIDLARKVGETDIRFQCRTSDGLVAVVGPSGIGKSTVLNMVAGIVKPDKGHVVIGGETLFDSRSGIALPVAARQAGYVFQDRRLFPHMRVLGNLRYARRTPQPLDFDWIVEALGIAALLDRWPSTLSGGEAQRVAIGRALLSGPRFLLLDEPLASLDEPRRVQIRAIIDRIKQELRIPILLVSHDQADIAQLADTIISLPPDGLSA